MRKIETIRENHNTKNEISLTVEFTGGGEIDIIAVKNFSNVCKTKDCWTVIVDGQIYDSKVDKKDLKKVILKAIGEISKMGYPHEPIPKRGIFWDTKSQFGKALSDYAVRKKWRGSWNDKL